MHALNYQLSHKIPVDPSISVHHVQCFTSSEIECHVFPPLGSIFNQGCSTKDIKMADKTAAQMQVNSIIVFIAFCNGKHPKNLDFKMWYKYDLLIQKKVDPDLVWISHFQMYFVLRDPDWELCPGVEEDHIQFTWSANGCKMQRQHSKLKRKYCK